jgi:hypothetical protein
MPQSGKSTFPSTVGICRPLTHTPQQVTTMYGM